MIRPRSPSGGRRVSAPRERRARRRSSGLASTGRAAIMGVMASADRCPMTSSRVAACRGTATRRRRSRPPRPRRELPPRRAGAGRWNGGPGRSPARQSCAARAAGAPDRAGAQRRAPIRRTSRHRRPRPADRPEDAAPRRMGRTVSRRGGRYRYTPIDPRRSVPSACDPGRAYGRLPEPLNAAMPRPPFRFGFGPSTRPCPLVRKWPFPSVSTVSAADHAV